MAVADHLVLSAAAHRACLFEELSCLRQESFRLCADLTEVSMRTRDQARRQRDGARDGEQTTSEDGVHMQRVEKCEPVPHLV
jgi:hypothetical protein